MNTYILFFRKFEWLLIQNDVKKDLFFPMLRFFDVKTVKKQLTYGARDTRFYWLNVPHHFQYREIIKVTPYCNFDFRHSDQIVAESGLMDFYFACLIESVPKLYEARSELSSERASYNLGT